MSKLEDIARRAAVSITTVSNILNNKSSSIPVSAKTREKVLRIARELDYRPNLLARSLRTRKSSIVGVIVWDLTDPYFSAILNGIEHVLEESGFYLVLNNAKSDLRREKLCLEKLGKIAAEGVLVLGIGHQLEPDLFPEMVETTRTRNVVLVAMKTPRNNLSSVTVDNFQGGMLGAEYLIEGRRGRLVYVTARRMTTDEEDRLAGVCSAAEEHGLGDGFSVIETESGEEGGYNAAAEALRRFQPPLSIFAMDDTAAIGCIRAVKDRQLEVPADVAVVGFDDLSIAGYTEPRLTTVHQPRFELGRRGAELLLESIAGKESGAPRHVVLKPRIVIRESA